MEALLAVGVALVLSLPAIWIWLWPASRWARIAQHEAKYGTVLYQPLSVLRTIPSLVGGLWANFGWAVLLDHVSPHILNQAPVLIGLVLLVWPMAVPMAVWLSGHPAIFVPPGVRNRQLGSGAAALRLSEQRDRERLADRGHASGEVRLQGGRSYAIVGLAAGLLMTSGALLGAMFGGDRGWWAAAFWVATACFGLCSIAAVALLIPGAVYLELTPQGFAFHQIFKTWRYQWTEVAEFAPLWTWQPTVAIRFQPRYRGSRPWRFLRPAKGYDASVPGTYGMRAEDLANLMNGWREQFAHREG